MTKKDLHLKIIKGHEQKGVCPLCQKPAEAPHAPFCSRRCAQLDLGKWLTGDYAVAAYEAMDDSDVEFLLSSDRKQHNNE